MPGWLHAAQGIAGDGRNRLATEEAERGSGEEREAAQGEKIGRERGGLRDGGFVLLFWAQKLPLFLWPKTKIFGSKTKFRFPLKPCVRTSLDFFFGKVCQNSNLSFS